MSLVKWRPIREFDNLSRYMERLFEDVLEPFGRRTWWLPRISERDEIIPNVDMYDKKNEIVVKAQLPGVEKDDVDLTITKDSLTIKGEIKKEEVKDGDHYCSECTYGSFLRTISLPAEIDSAKAKAGFKNGVLEITLPKHEEAKASPLFQPMTPLPKSLRDLE